MARVAQPSPRNCSARSHRSYGAHASPRCFETPQPVPTQTQTWRIKTRQARQRALSRVERLR